MKNTTIYIFCVAAMTLLAAGCRKDNTIDGMLIVSEGMRSDNKAMIEGLNMTWVAGESILINGEDKAIAVNDENQAYLENVTASDVYRAIYPSSLNSSATLDDDSVTVTIPSTHTYNSDANGNQLLDIPMAGRSESGSSLYLKHLTAAITVEITNYYGFAVLVDSVVVTSSDAGTAYQISGVTSINLADANMGITTNSNPTAAQKKVKMIFGDGVHAMKIDQGATKKVQVPVLPVGSGNKFSISVTVHKDGDAAVTKTFTKTQGTGGAMGRAKMAYAGHTVGFLFSIGTNKKVIISQGNLQYQASSRTWRFAANQYDYIGAAAGNTTTMANGRASQAAWIDLFGWGTSGWDNGYTHYYRPYDVGSDGQNSGYGYGPTNGIAFGFSLTGAYAESDWGVYNRINNGGNATGMWRTLTGGSGSETDTLFSKRSTSTTNMPVGTNDEQARYIKATVEGIKGIILFPDDYRHPNDIEIDGSNRCYNTVDNNYSFYDFATGKSVWSKMEAAGAVFLPAAGYRNNTTISEANTTAYYWSASSSGPSNAYAIKFFDSNGTTKSSTAIGIPRSNGCSVRLVMDVR